MNLLLRSYEDNVHEIPFSGAEQIEETAEMAEPKYLSKRRKLLEKFTSHKTTEAVLDMEIKSYLSIPPPSNVKDDSAIMFWKDQYKAFPRVASLARQLLAISPGSVAVENMFSTTGLILNSKRQAIAPHRLNYLSFIHDNFSLFF